MQNHIFNALNSGIENYKIIPTNMSASKYYCVTFEGWQNVSFTAADQNLLDLIDLASSALTAIIFKYKDSHAFTEPQFFFKPDHSYGIKVGTLELEIYDQIMSKNDAFIK